MRTTWRAWACIVGTMGESTQDFTRTIKSMGTAFTYGLTIGTMLGIGTVGNNMVLGPTTCRRKKRSSTVYGRTVRGLNGLIKNRCKR